MWLCGWFERARASERMCVWLSCLLARSRSCARVAWGLLGASTNQPTKMLGAPTQVINIRDFRRAWEELLQQETETRELDVTDYDDVDVRCVRRRAAAAAAIRSLADVD